MKRRKKEQTGGAAAAVQVRERGGHPFAALRGYMPLGGADAALYRSVREAVPIVDAAIGKLVRLSGGFACCVRTSGRRRSWANSCAQ